MKRYRHSAADTGILAYDYGEDWIAVRFKNESVYEYTQASAGRKAITTMKQLADAGEGLTTFINQFVKDRYARRLR